MFKYMHCLDTRKGLRTMLQIDSVITKTMPTVTNTSKPQYASHQMIRRICISQIQNYRMSSGRVSTVQLALRGRS